MHAFFFGVPRVNDGRLADPNKRPSIFFRQTTRTIFSRLMSSRQHFCHPKSQSLSDLAVKKRRPKKALLFLAAPKRHDLCSRGQYPDQAQSVMYLLMDARLHRVDGRFIRKR